MQIFIYKDNQQLGPFPVEKVKEMVQLGSVVETDLAWHEGAPDWVPLNALAAYAGAAAVTPPPASSMSSPYAAASPVETGPDRSSLLFGALGGAGAALAAGIVWALIIVMAEVEIGWLAIGVGAICGWAVKVASRGGGGPAYQVTAAACSVLGILIGKYGAFYHFLVKAVKEMGDGSVPPSSVFSPTAISLFFQSLGSMLSGFDALWAILAISAAWRIPSIGGASAT